MRVLITGITGFVGSHLADFLLENEDCEIYGFKRWNLSRLRNIHHIMDKVKLYDCDITDSTSVYKALKEIKPDVIYHLAAESFVSTSWDHPRHYMDVNYLGTINILDSLVRLNMNPRILIAGSGEEYGEIKEEELPITTETILRPVNPYAVTKIAQDLIGYVYYKSYGLNVIRTRAFNHEGPRRDNVFGISSFAYQIARIEQGLQEPEIRVGKITDRRNFTHIHDLVNAYYLATKHCIPGELYLIGSEDQSRIFTFEEVLHRLIEKSNLNLDDINIIEEPKFVRPTSVPRLIGDTHKFRDLTGWKPNISFEDMLDDILDYWRDFVKKDMY